MQGRAGGLAPSASIGSKNISCRLEAARLERVISSVVAYCMRGLPSNWSGTDLNLYDNDCDSSLRFGVARDARHSGGMRLAGTGERVQVRKMAGRASDDQGGSGISRWT